MYCQWFGELSFKLETKHKRERERHPSLRGMKAV